MEELAKQDVDGKGELPSEAFIRCLSKKHMKIGPTEMDKLCENLKTEGDMVSYKDFLKYSYLCHLYLNQTELEYAMREVDNNSGMITVAQLDEILKKFTFPANAIDQVF